jgi:hypothetical protein
MTRSAWRDAWPDHRVRLVEETSRCMADQRSLRQGGPSTKWDDLSSIQKSDLTELVAWVFLAQEKAMDILIERGQLP